MADDRSNIPSPFDVKTIKYLVGLMSQHDLSEVDLREGDLRIRLRRGPKGITVQPMMSPVPTATPPPAPRTLLKTTKSFTLANSPGIPDAFTLTT